jgi:ATP-dependent protease HslVU (ClpYQ) peptidase subunit
VTCIIAHRDGWMVADRRETFTGGLIGPYIVNKIKRGNGIIAAACGNGLFQDLIAEAFDETRELAPAAAMHALVRVFRNRGSEVGGHALALTADGIYEITSHGALSQLDADHWAIGSGYQFALGWLAAVKASRPITVADALQAINFASTRVNDVGDGYQTEYL